MDDVEKVAEIIYGAMTWANQRPASGRTPPPWMPGGNSDAQECARQTARAALTALGGWNEAIEAANNAVSTLKERAEHHHHNDAIYLALTAINNLRRPTTKGPAR